MGAGAEGLAEAVLLGAKLTLAAEVSVGWGLGVPLGLPLGAARLAVAAGAVAVRQLLAVPGSSVEETLGEGLALGAAPVSVGGTLPLQQLLALPV